MSRYIGNYVRHCDLCCRTKVRRRKPIGELHPVPTPSDRWEKVSVDFITELPPSDGFDAIMVAVDSMGKRAHFISTYTKITAEGAARLFLREIWRLHGLPSSMFSDRGPQFIADFMRELHRLLGIDASFTTAYHPQADGQTERVNQELEQYLRLFANEAQDDWNELLCMGEFAYNNHVHSSTQQTPFFLDTGRHPRMGFEPTRVSTTSESANEFRDRMANSMEEAKAALEKAKAEYTQYYNRRREPAPTFDPGDMVFVDASDIRTTRPSKKLDHLRYGPYKVLAKVGPAAYKLKLPYSMRRLHPVFPVVKLTLSPPDPIEGREHPTHPDPEIVDGEEEYEVEEILNSRIRWRRVEYKVRWQGYGPEDDTWQRWKDLAHAEDKVRAFHRAYPNKPCHINAAMFHLSPPAFQHIPFREPPSILPSWRKSMRLRRVAES
jgi:transposase InsO family protein